MNTLVKNKWQTPMCSDLLQVNTSITKDQSTIIKAWTEAAELTTKYLEGQQAVEMAKVLGR